jgi:2-methylcitrate dehydratase PrpD
MSALAAGEWLDATVEEMLEAIIVGYEVVARVATAINPQHYDRGFHPTGTCNPIGVAATAAKLLRLDAAQTCGALRLAADTACGFRQYQLDGNIVNSAYHAAKAAENGITSALLAAEGFADPGESLTGRFGLFGCEAGDWAKQALLGELGTEYRFLQASLKPYPSCRFMHGAVDATAACLNEHRLNVEDIASIRISSFKMAVEEGDRPRPKTVLDAQFSIHYNIAEFLLKRGLSIDDFTPEAIENPKAIAYEKLVTVVEDDELTAQYPDLWPYRADITTRDGRGFSSAVSRPSGSPDYPLSQEALENKSRLLLEPVVGVTQSLDFIAKIKDLKSFGSCRNFAAYLRSWDKPPIDKADRFASEVGHNVNIS